MSINIPLCRYWDGDFISSFVNCIHIPDNCLGILRSKNRAANQSEMHQVDNSNDRYEEVIRQGASPNDHLYTDLRNETRNDGNYTELDKREPSTDHQYTDRTNETRNYSSSDYEIGGQYMNS